MVSRLTSTLASGLASSWRQRPPSLPLRIDELTGLAPLLCESGAGGLVWRRLRGSALEASRPARVLRDLYRHYVLDATTQEERLPLVVALLRHKGIEPVLVKGWSVARLYPEIGSRPCGDIDLCVAPERMADATAALMAAGSAARDVDLHAGFADLEDHGWDKAFRRSRLVPLERTDIRILGAEDQLRQLCLHLMRHGGFRPLWLCDVAVALEALPPSFDWDYCLRGERCLTDWVVCTIGLARKLLDARIADTEVARRADALPRWLESTVLHLWGQGSRSSDVVSMPFSAYPRTWTGLRTALGQRWPNPIRATYKLRRSPFTRLPRKLVQLAAFFIRTSQFAVSKLQPVETLARPFDIHPAHIR